MRDSEFAHPALGVTPRLPVRMLRAIMLALLASAALSGSAAASSFQVNPVNIILAPDRASASVSVTNTDKASVAVRVVPYKWTQEEGADVYAPTSNLIASPPIFVIQPGKTQLVRLGFAAREGKAYRVILEEIPRPNPGGAIQVALRLNLPLYLEPAKGGQADLAWSIYRDSAGETILEGRNAGNVHAQILGIEAQDPAGKRTILSKQMAVILPGSARHWKLGKRTDLGIGMSTTLWVRNSTRVITAKAVVEAR
jgi:fimbrial chaperone protein